jgi:transcriptional regulator with XRE-family HTH domain
MRALQKQGLSFRDIAERLGVSKSSVGRKLNGGEA